MARGLDIHQARQQALGLLGKDLARRARRRCELCEDRDSPLHPFEVPPQPEEPALDRCLLLCERCRAGAGGEPLDPEESRFLETVAWSELAPAQVTAVRLLRRLADQDTHWARATLENLYLDPEVEAWADQA